MDGSVVIGSPPLISAMDFGHELKRSQACPILRKRKEKPRANEPLNHPLKDDPPSTPRKTNMSPENHWLEDVFPIEIVPFQATCCFSGVYLCVCVFPPRFFFGGIPLTQPPGTAAPAAGFSTTSALQDQALMALATPPEGRLVGPSEIDQISVTKFATWMFQTSVLHSVENALVEPKIMRIMEVWFR